MSDVEEAAAKPVRKTRSGRAVKTPAKPKATAKAAPASRKTRKKVVVMEVEVSDDEDNDPSETSEPAEKRAKIDEDKLLETSDDEAATEDSSHHSSSEAKIGASELIMNDIAMLEEIIHTNEKITEKVQESEIAIRNSKEEEGEDNKENGVIEEAQKIEVPVAVQEKIAVVEEKQSDKVKAVVNEKKSEEAIVVKEKKIEQPKVVVKETKSEEVKVAIVEKTSEDVKISIEEQKSKDVKAAAAVKQIEEANVAVKEVKTEEAKPPIEEKKSIAAKVAVEEKKSEVPKVAVEDKKSEVAKVSAEEKKSIETKVTVEEKKSEAPKVAVEEKKSKSAKVAIEKEKVPVENKQSEEKRLAVEKKQDEKKTAAAEEKPNDKEKVAVEENLSDKQEVAAQEKQSGEVAITAQEKPIEEKEKEVKEVDKETPKEKTAESTVTVETPKAKPMNVEPEAENISDDELPGVPVVKVPETEEVSDEELPGPKRAELPADTEVVSEDELPASKKDADEEETGEKKESGKRKLSESGYDPTSPTSESEAPPKKSKEDKEEKDGEATEAAKSAKPKKLPELDKYWKAVNDDPTDFTGWTYLLQYVDQENDMEAAREAYDAFLSHYPYCYGYWRKYADYEKRKGNKKKCEEVFERGLKAIPLSVDLWIHYLTYVKSTRAEDEEFVRSQFERALGACGLEFRSDRLWDSYIKWETEGKRLQKVTGLFDRLLATPTQGYTSHFDNFQEHVSSNAPNKFLEVDEFLALRKEVRGLLKKDEKAADNADLPPGDEDSKLYTSDEESKCIRERIVSIRRKIHKNTVNAVTSRWNFEEGIKRPYFHVKPLERCQLKNWQEYLDFEIEQGNRVRIIVLFERCLIACALYEEFWLKFVHYLEGLKDPELQTKIREVYERACTIHHLKKPNLHLQWAAFEEAYGNVNRAAEILVNLEKQVPNVLQVAYRRINLERRRSNFEKAGQLFEHYIGNSKNKMISSNIAIKYSRFCLRVLKDFDKAKEILKTAISKDPVNPRLYLQLVDLTLQKDGVKEEDVVAVIDEFLEKDNADPDQKALFAQRKLEYLEDFGSSIQTVQATLEQYQKYQKLAKEASKKKEVKSETSGSSKKEKTTPTASQSQPYSNYNYGSSSNQPPYTYSGSQQGQYNYPQYGQSGDQYQYQNWQYPQAGGAYGGYNQWGGYTGGYGY